jgi:hypothetical protein
MKVSLRAKQVRCVPLGLDKSRAGAQSLHLQ